MAAPAWKKLTTSDLRHLDAHLDQDERAARTHSNEDIDPERTHENYFIGCISFKEICEKALKRVAEVDAENPPIDDKGADRIIAVNILIYCPIEITQAGMSEEFFENAARVIEEFVGEKDFHGGVTHRDEVHNYIDATTKKARTSLEHAHFTVTPYAEWKDPIYKKERVQMTDKRGHTYEREVIVKNENGRKIIEGYRERKGINGKNFETRESLSKLNKMMDEMCYEHFGIGYNTGGRKNKKTVEQLKRESEIAALDAEIIKLNNECDKLDDYYDLMDKECDKIEEECDRLNAEADAAERRKQTVLKDVALTEIEAQNYELMRERLEEIDPNFLDNLERKSYETEQKIDAEFPKANDKKGLNNYNER